MDRVLKINYPQLLIRQQHKIARMIISMHHYQRLGQRAINQTIEKPIQQSYFLLFQLYAQQLTDKPMTKQCHFVTQTLSIVAGENRRVGHGFLNL